MIGQRPYAWEKTYPPNVRWDAPLEQITLPALIDRAVRTYADKTALRYRANAITYAALGEMVDRAAAGLRALGVGRGTHVALYLPNSPYHPIAFFGVLKAGGRVVHLSPLDAERELAFKLKDSGARVLITTNLASMLPMALKLAAGACLVDRLIVGDDAFWGVSPVPTTPIPENEPRVVTMATVLAHEPLAESVPTATDDVAVLQYTGGTTGTPKGALLTHGNLSAAVSSYNFWYEGQGILRRGGGEKVVCALPLFHIYSLTTILLRYINNGNEILLHLRFDAEAAARDIEVGRATAFLGVPTMWIGLAALPNLEKRDFSSLRHCVSGGGPLPVEIAHRFKKTTGLWVGGGWGMTETSPLGTHLPRDTEFTLGAIGIPLPGVYMDVVALDDPRRILKPGETGEFRIAGPNVTQGYWQRPEETKNAFVDGCFLTGDVGHMDENGFFYLLDRKKDMIISGGFNVFPRMVEEAIYEHPHIEEAVVIGVPDDYRGECAKAFVKLRAGAPQLTLEALQGFLADKLGRHEMPTALEIRDALPRTAVGKLSKKELVEEERAKRRTTPATSAD